MGLVASQQCCLRCAVTWTEPKTTRSRAGRIVSFVLFLPDAIVFGKDGERGRGTGRALRRATFIRAARGQNTVGSCVHSAANYTHHCVSSLLSWWVPQDNLAAPQHNQCKGINTAGEAKGVQIQPNYIYLYLLQGITAAGRRPCVTGGKATARFSYRAAI